MKIALITDTHAGARNDSLAFNKYFMNFYNDVFFPTLEKEGVTSVIHLGDLFDRRKYTNNYIISEWKKGFFDKLKNYNCHFLVGNHDIYWKNSNEVSTTDLLLREYDFMIYSEPEEIVIDGVNILMMPWINSSNYEECSNAIKESNSTIMMGHLEVNGFEMYKGSYCDDGLSPSMFNKFDMVFSGHFHHKSDNGTIYYLGNPYHLTWMDYGDERGFHIFDTKTRELTFIKNPYSIFKKLIYNDENLAFDDIINEDRSDMEGCYVKVIVQNKTDGYLFDKFIEQIEKNNSADISVVDNIGIEMMEDTDIIDEAEDTLTILSKYIDGLSLNVDKQKLDNLMKTLYNESLTLEIS